MNRRCIPMACTDGPNIIALYGEGVPVGWIARYTGRPAGSIIQFLQRHEEWSREKAVEIDTARARRLLIGRSFVAVAEMMGCSVDGLRRAVRAAGEPRRYTDMSEEEKEQIRGMYLAGVPWRRIRATTGRSQGCIMKALQGVPRRGWVRGRSWDHPWHKERTAEIERWREHHGK
jgi:hypothetical protein